MKLKLIFGQQMIKSKFILLDKMILKYLLVLSIVGLNVSCNNDGVSEAVDQVYLAQADDLRMIAELERMSDLFDDRSLTNSNGNLEFKIIASSINENKFDSINTIRLSGVGIKDSIRINSVKRIEDFVQFNVSYPGGCKDHELEVVWDGKVYTDDPCHMNLMLLHDAHEDNCEAYITETYYLSLAVLMQGVSYKDSCDYNIYSTFNATTEPDIIIPKLSN